MATPTPIDSAAVVTQTTTAAAPYIPLLIGLFSLSAIGVLFVALKKLTR